MEDTREVPSGSVVWWRAVAPSIVHIQLLHVHATHWDDIDPLVSNWMSACVCEVAVVNASVLAINSGVFLLACLQMAVAAGKKALPSVMAARHM